jgi:hypothetical protein
MKQKWKFFTSATRYPSIREKVSKWKEGLFSFSFFLVFPLIRSAKTGKKKRKEREQDDSIKTGLQTGGKKRVIKAGSSTTVHNTNPSRMAQK